MTRTALPPSTFPDILIAGDVTYLALPMPSGLEVYVTSPTMPLTIVDTFPVGSWPRFYNHPSGVLLAYKTADDNCLSVANATTGALTKTGVPAYWNSPCVWDSDGTLAVQATPDAQVWSAVWPLFPRPPAIRQGAGTGLAQWVGNTLETWDEMGVTVQPVILFGAMVSQANAGGVAVRLGAADGILDPGTITNNPRPALAADGSLSFVYWSQDGHGATQTVLYQGVTAADLGPAQYPVTPLTKPTLFGVFQRVSTLPTYANALVQIPTDGGIIGYAPNGIKVHWNVFDLESRTGNRTSPCCYIGAPESFAANLGFDAKSDILSPWIYPESGETSEDFSAKAHHWIAFFQTKYPAGTVIAPIWRVDTRITGNPPVPTLTEDMVLHCLSIASTEFPGLPALFFQGDRAGFVSAAVPMLEKWRNGQPCSVPIQPIPPPPINNNATLRRRLTMPYPPLAGFRKTQFTKDPSNGNYLNLAVQNPIAVAYDGGPAVGTVLRNARTGQPMPQGLALVCLDRAGNWTGMPTDTVGIGWFGFWSITGNLAYICPRNQDGTNDQSFTFIVVD